MINRILIRNKVVQTLYSYLLTKSEFTIESEPITQSKERRFAYSVYINTLRLIFELNGLARKRNANNNSANTKLVIADGRLSLIKSLFSEEKVQLALQNETPDFSYSSALIDELIEKISSSSPYKSFIRQKNPDSIKEAKLWRGIIEDVIGKNEMYISELRKNIDFSLSGFERGLRQVSETIESFNDTHVRLYDAEKELNTSLNKAHELYLSLLLLPLEITKIEERNIDNAKHKLLPTSSDLNPNTKFIDNALPELLRNTIEINNFLKSEKDSWANNEDFIKKMLELVKSSDIYKEYMDVDGSDREQDCEFWRKIMKKVLLPSDELTAILEDKSVYWNDDIDIIGTFVNKTLKQAGKSSDSSLQILPKFKDLEDEKFGKELFDLAVKNYNEYRGIIQKFINTSSWDPERIAFMDVVILVVAISEILHFQKIALPVSINEYVEIAKNYSTTKSGQFVNGILFSVTNYLRETGKLIGK